MKKYSEIGEKMFNSKCENESFVEDKIKIHKKIFEQLFFNLEDIDIDNINNEFWLKTKNQLEKYGYPNIGCNSKILDKNIEFIYWRIINLFIKDYINDTLHFDDIRNDLESNELYLYSFAWNLSKWFSYTLCNSLSSIYYDPIGSKMENDYTRAFSEWNMSLDPKASLMNLLKNHFNKIKKTIDIICKFCFYRLKEDKNGWSFFIKSNEAILIDEIKSKEIKFNLIDKLIDFKKVEHDPQKASKHLFDILKEPYSFIDGDKNRADAEEYFNSQMLKKWRDKTQVIRHMQGDTTSRRDVNIWFKEYDKMPLCDKQKFQYWILIVALMIYVWHFSIREK